MENVDVQETAYSRSRRYCRCDVGGPGLRGNRRKVHNVTVDNSNYGVGTVTGPVLYPNSSDVEFYGTAYVVPKKVIAYWPTVGWYRLPTDRPAILKSAWRDTGSVSRHRRFASRSAIGDVVSRQLFAAPFPRPRNPHRMPAASKSRHALETPFLAPCVGLLALPAAGGRACADAHPERPVRILRRLPSRRARKLRVFRTGSFFKIKDLDRLRWRAKGARCRPATAAQRGRGSPRRVCNRDEPC